MAPEVDSLLAAPLCFGVQQGLVELEVERSTPLVLQLFINIKQLQWKKFNLLISLNVIGDNKRKF